MINIRLSPFEFQTKYMFMKNYIYQANFCDLSACNETTGTRNNTVADTEIHTDRLLVIERIGVHYLMAYIKPRLLS